MPIYVVCYVLMLPVSALAACFLALQLLIGHFDRQQNFLRGLWMLVKWLGLTLAEPLKYGWFGLGLAVVIIGAPVLLLVAGAMPTWRTHGFVALASIGTVAILYIVSKSGVPKDVGEALFFLPSMIGIVVSGFMAYRQLR